MTVVEGRYEGPRGDGWTVASFLHDGGRRWRIEDDEATGIVLRMEHPEAGRVRLFDLRFPGAVDPARFRWAGPVDEDLRAGAR